MIRTHKPRGYAWTCASLFQQTPDFRNISYEGCIVEDEHDEFALPERSAKRQRVEKLADDFLNGRALNIPSARLAPQDIQHAVARSFPRPKDARRAMVPVDVKTSGEAVWEDVQDHWEVLAAHNHVKDEVVVEVHAQASCSSIRQQRVVKLAIGPSEEALRQAAALRNRNVRRSGRLSVPFIQRAQSEAVIEETQEDRSNSAVLSIPSDIGSTPTAAWTSSKWLQSGMLELRHKAVDEECSKDELGLSSLPTPGQEAASRPSVSLRRGRSAVPERRAAITSSTDCPNGGVSSPAQAGEQSSGRTIDELRKSHVTAYVLVSPAECSGKESDMALGKESQGDSQVQLLGRQGIRTAPQKSWASSEATAESSAESHAPSTCAPNEEPKATPATKASLLQSGNLNAGRPLRGKRATKSTGNAPRATVRRPSRRKSAPSESQAAADSVTDLPINQQRRMASFRAAENTYESVTGKDSSPFMFRKRVSKFNNSDDEDVETMVVEKKQQSRTKPPGHENFPSDSLRLQQTKVALKPVLADPKTPLVNEYLNHLLPNEESDLRSTLVRKALRDEMRLAGAEFSRVAGEAKSSQEVPTSSEKQADSPEHNLTANGGASEIPPLQLWPGTQVLLAEAQKDLFNSPNKENTALHLGGETTPQTTRDLPRRKALQTLSQEHRSMPSTQALLDGWQGWSTIKKPRSAAGKRNSILPSPSLHKGSSTLAHSGSVTSHSFDEARLRKSSLRYSMSYNDTPDLQQTKALPITAFVPARQSARDFVEDYAIHVEHAREQEQRPRRPSGGIASSAAFTQGPLLSTTERGTVSSLSIHASLSSREQITTSVQPPQQDSSISFSPVVQYQPTRTEPPEKPLKHFAKPKPTTRTEPIFNEESSWSFSPLAQPSTTVTHGINTDIVTTTPMSDHYQQAQDPAASRFLSQVGHMDSQELEFTVSELVDDCLASARRGMPVGIRVGSQ